MDKNKLKHLNHNGNEAHLLREIVRTYQTFMSGFSQKMGMTASQFMLMRILATSEEDIGIMELSRQLEINAAAVTRQVQELEKAGIIKRRIDPKDKRRSYIKLSQIGKKKFQEIHKRSHDLEQAFSKVLSPEMIKTTIETLDKLRSFINYK